MSNEKQTSDKPQDHAPLAGVVASTDCWIILQNGKPLLFNSQLPTFWYKKTAESQAEKFSNTEVVKGKIGW